MFVCHSLYVDDCITVGSLVATFPASNVDGAEKIIGTLLTLLFANSSKAIFACLYHVVCVPSYSMYEINMKYIPANRCRVVESRYMMFNVNVMLMMIVYRWMKIYDELKSIILYQLTMMYNDVSTFQHMYIKNFYDIFESPLKSRE